MRDARLLQGWLGRMPLDEFVRRHLGRAIAQPGTTRGAIGLLDWQVIERVLAGSAPAADVLVVARGRLLSLAPPRTLEALRAYLARGVGLCLRFAERCDPGLANVADAFSALGRAHVQLFVTPGGTSVGVTRGNAAALPG